MDELRDAISAAVDKEEANATPEPVETPAVAEAPESAVPERETGAAVEPSEPATKDEKPVGKKVEIPDGADAKPDEAPTPGQHRVDRAPASWRKEAKGEWASVPLHIRQEVHKREMEITRALNEANTASQAANQFQQVAQPYMARIQSLGVTPQQAFGELLKADYLLASGSPQSKAQLIDKLIQDYGVDVAELDATIARRLSGSQQVAPQQPDIAQLVQQQLQQALAPIYQQQQQVAQQQQQQADQTIEQMSLDPKYPHFEEVRQDMADLIEINSRRGVYITLEQAYNRAVSGNPDLSAQQQAIQLNNQAQQAKAAALSVSGAPAGSGSPTHVSTGNLRADLEAAFAGNRL